MKIHHILVDNIVKALEDIIVDRQFADKVIERNFKSHRKWGSRDRKFFAENVYDVVRWYRTLAYIANTDTDFWRILAVHWLRKGQELPPMEEFIDIDPSILQREARIQSYAVLQSYPDWLYDMALAELGNDWHQCAAAMNNPADVFLRVNALRATPDQVIKALGMDEVLAEKVLTEQNPEMRTGVAGHNELPWALRLLERKNVFSTKAFRDGLFEVQDAASQLVVPMLEVEPGMRVIDACAGGGGKSLHMSSLMKNKGKIIALDIHEWKLKSLKERAKRNGVDIIEARLIDSQKVIKRMHEAADRLLLDVPCSGVGVLRRNPDAKWKLSAEELARLNVIQADILKSYCVMTKVGGKMVYATCSVLPSENEKQVAKFLKENDGWKLEKEIHLRADKQGYDGFYAARLLREK